MTNKERNAHNRFLHKAWKDEFIKWILLDSSDYIVDEVQTTYSRVTVPKKDGKKCYFDVILTKEGTFNKTFSAVSINELLFAINHPHCHKFVLITEHDGKFTITKSYTYRELIPLLDISPFVFKFHFKDYDLSMHDELDFKDLRYKEYPEEAVKLTGNHLVELLNLFGDYKTHKK